MKKKILILGNGANAYALAKKLSEQHEIYITTASDTLKEFATCIDIREDNVPELLEFAMENGIDLTIPVSQKSVQSDIAAKFSANRQLIFAPTAKAAEVVFNKIQTKKTLYKLKIPTPKFGIFEKQNMAADYLKTQEIPFVLKTNDSNSAVILTSALSAKNIIDSMFIDKDNKVIIEDYVYGTPFSFYAITDGYKALPIGSSITFKHSLEGEGGQLTSGMGAICPNYKISIEQEYYLMDNVIYPLLNYLEHGQNPYSGIIGVNGILSDDGNISILGWQSFMLDCDAASILSLIEEDLYSLFEACAIGSFSDEYDIVKQSDGVSVSVVLSSNTKETKENIISGLENDDDNILISYYPSVSKNRYLELQASYGPVLVLSSKASTQRRACNIIDENIDLINFSGKNFRKDILHTDF